MTPAPDQHAPAYDPFGEPMAPSRVSPETRSAAPGSYRETSRAALVFWVLAALFVGGRIYLSEQPVGHETSASVSQGTVLR